MNIKEDFTNMNNTENPEMCGGPAGPEQEALLPAVPGKDVPMVEDTTHGEIPEEVMQPDGLKKARWVSVPDLMTVHTWFFRHYRLTMYSFLNHMLKSGNLHNLIHFDFVSRAINRECCSFPSAAFFDDGRDAFFADITAELKLNTLTGTRNWKGVLTFHVRVSDDGYEAVITDFVPEYGLQSRERCRLDPYLIPYMKNRILDEEAEKLWRRTIPEANTDPEARKGEALAARLGLSVIYAPIAGNEEEAGYLFFTPDVLQIKDKNDPDPAPPRTLEIPGKTIVINTNRIPEPYADYAIFHECWHYQRHYLFFRLQQMNSSDFSSVRMKKQAVREGMIPADPLYMMEKQANRGALALLLPVTDTKRRIAESMALFPDSRHAGYLMDQVIRDLWKKIHVPYFRLKARMVQLGWPEAKGAMNYVGSGWIEPFAFDREDLPMEEMTFVIHYGDVRRLTEENPGFRELMETGGYVYADGHVLRRRHTLPAEDRGLVLTPEANRDVGTYCLRFRQVYEQRGPGKYVYGRLSFDDSYHRRIQFFLQDLITPEQDELDAKLRFKKEFPDDFKTAYRKIQKMMRERENLTMEDLAEALGLGDVRNVYYRMDAEPGKVSLDFVIASALVWKLPDWITQLLLERAHILLTETDRRHRAILYIMRVMWEDGIDKANEYLVSRGVEPLNV